MPAHITFLAIWTENSQLETPSFSLSPSCSHRPIILVAMYSRDGPFTHHSRPYLFPPFSPHCGYTGSGFVGTEESDFDASLVRDASIFDRQRRKEGLT